MPLLSKRLISTVLRAFRVEEEKAFPSMNGFYPLPLTPDGGRGNRTCDCQLSISLFRYKQRELIGLCCSLKCGLSELASTHMHTLGEDVCGGGDSSCLEHHLSADLRWFLKPVVTPHMCLFQSVNIQL